MIMTLSAVFLPVLNALGHVISWLYSVVEVVDKCFESLPRGPVGSSHGDFAEVEFTIGSSGGGAGGTNSDLHQRAIGEKIKNSLKVVETASIRNSSRVPLDDSNGPYNNTCAVCLAEILEDEKVYELPQCRHVFHSPCLDRWVAHNHSTCPLCRTSLIPSSAAGYCCSGGSSGASMNNQDEELVLEEEPPAAATGLSFGIWFVSRYYARNFSFSSNNGWTHTLARLAGF